MSRTDDCSPKRLSIVIPDLKSPYAELGAVESVNFLSFAYQIASGMVYYNS